MSISENIRKDMFLASKEGRADESNILKMAMAAIKNVEIETQKELEDTEVEKILRKETKKISDSIVQYESMGRDDLLAREKTQLEVLNKYLPQLMTEEEVKKVVEQKIAQLGVQDMKDMGKVMGAVMSELGSKTDGNTVKTLVQEILQK